MTQAKEILKDILDAFCLSTQNTNKVYKLSGIKSPLFNGKRNYDQIRALLLRAISEDKAKEIINQMPFPFISVHSGVWINDITKRDFEEILVPLEKKKGYRMENVTTGWRTTWCTAT